MCTKSPSPAVAAKRMIRAARKVGPLSGGFTTDIELAQRIVAAGRGSEFMALFERIRAGWFFGSYGSVATATRWILEHPGEEPTCVAIWPAIFNRAAIR